MKTIKQILLTMAVLLFSLTANAYDFEIDGIYYNIISIEDLTVEVTNEYNNEYIGNIIIPTTVAYKENVLTVIGIQSFAFSGCSALTSITIPNSVTSIGVSAFDGCTSLKTLRFEDGAETLNLGYKQSANSYLYHSGLFNDCPLDTLYLGRNISYKNNQYYGYSPFYYQNLKSIIISDCVTSIGYYAFYGCSRLASVTIGNSVTSIGISAFEGCTGLTSIDIPNSVMSIGVSAFEGCTGLTSVEFNAENCTSMGDFYHPAFCGCTALSIVTIGENVKSIPAYAFSGCTGLTNVTIGNSVTSIDVDAFSGCTGLTSIDIPNSVISIRGGAFEGCTGLTSIEIPNSVTSIGSYTFSGCYSITNITIPNSVTSIGYDAFKGCSRLKSVCNFSNLKFTKGSSDYGSVAYYADNVYNAPNGSMEGDFIFGKTNDVNTLLYYLGNATELTLPADYKGENYAIGAVFKGNITIKSVTIPNSITSIESYAFSGCSSLENLRIGDGMKSIEEYAFYNCSNLKEIVLGKRINYIGNYAFASSNKIESIYALPTRAINCENATTAFHQNAYKYATLYVKESSIDSYETTEPWSKFYIEPIGDFTLTYMVDGEVYKKEKYEYDSAITPLAQPEKEGHTFSGWSEIPETMPAEDITITGSFSVNAYAITYIVDGEVYATDSLEYSSEIVLIDEPTKEGHTFSGWSEAPETMPAEDIEITGSFSVNTYAITYIVDGEVYATDSLTYGSEIVLIDEPTKEGHTFSWSETPETMPAEDIEITGSFSVNTYAITYMVDGEVYATDSLAYGSEIVLIDEPTKEGYTFSGWSEAPETMPANDITITGSFSVNSYTITYIVDGEVYATDSLAYGSEIVLIDEPTKEGHTFSGWSEIPETMPANDIEITGSFSVNTYTITYIVDGEVYATDELTYGSEIILRDEPTKEGYSFSGWSEAPETMPAEDIEITGSFIPTENVSEVEFDANIQTTNNGIILLNADNNWVRVYTINGILLKKIDNYTGEEITLNKGVYIVSVGNKAIKIML